MTVTISGVSLINETASKNHAGSFNRGELRLAASSSQCTIHVSYSIKKVYWPSGEESAKAGSTDFKADYLELNENWANTRPVQQKVASSQVHKGLGPHNGEFSIPVEVNNMIKKYMLSAYSSFLNGDVHLSVLIVSGENRHLLEE